MVNIMYEREIKLAEDVTMSHEFVEANDAVLRAIENGFSIDTINNWLNEKYLSGLYYAEDETGLMAPSCKVLYDNPDILEGDMLGDMNYIAKNIECELSIINII